MILPSEIERYDRRVIEVWNPKEYCNEGVMGRWIDGQILPYLSKDGEGSDRGRLPSMALLDCAAFHKTPGILNNLRSYNITPSLLPPNRSPYTA